jgi:hypothetical protein
VSSLALPLHLAGCCARAAWYIASRFASRALSSSRCRSLGVTKKRIRLCRCTPPAQGPAGPFYYGRLGQPPATSGRRRLTNFSTSSCRTGKLRRNLDAGSTSRRHKPSSHIRHAIIFRTLAFAGFQHGCSRLAIVRSYPVLIDTLYGTHTDQLIENTKKIGVSPTDIKIVC